jgi:hypothetical protein
MRPLPIKKLGIPSLKPGIDLLPVEPIPSVMAVIRRI